MPNKSAHSITTAAPASVDAFLAIANVYLKSAERLHALNFSALREAVEDAATASRSLLAMTADPGGNKHQSAFASPVIEKSAAYYRCAYEIFATTQQEVAQTLTSQFASFDPNLNLPGEWNKPFEFFAKSVQQLSRATAKPVSPAGATASSAYAEALSRARKAA